MVAIPAEPLVYSFYSTISRLSGFFYQCYLIPLALAILTLCVSGEKKVSLSRAALHTLLYCVASATLYFLIAPYVGDFANLSAMSHILLLALIVLYAAFFCSMRSHVRVVMAAAIIANINWAQAISTQVFMPLLTLSLSNTLQLLLLLAALTVIYLFRPSRTTERVPTAYWLTMLIIAVISTACLYTFRALGTRRMDNGGGDQMTLSIVLSAFFVVNLLIYYLYFVLVKEHRAASDMKAMQAKLEQDLEFYRRSETLIQEYRSLRHELKNHFSVMEGLLREERYDQLRQYFADYAGKITPQLMEFHCPNRLVSSVISHQMNTALAAGVTLDVIAAVPETLGIADDDLCSLLSNMLDNGVEGCLRAGQKSVKATLHTDKSALFITVTNPAPADVLTSNPDLTTTKPNASGHGFGIPIIRRITEKYDGIVTFHMDDGWFTVDAMLYMED